MIWFLLILGCFLFNPILGFLSFCLWLGLSKELSSKPLIVLDNRKSATSYIADVVLPTAISGIENGGLSYRLDQVPIELQKIINPPNNIPSDEELLSRILRKLTNE